MLNNHKGKKLLELPNLNFIFHNYVFGEVISICCCLRKKIQIFFFSEFSYKPY